MILAGVLLAPAGTANAEDPEPQIIGGVPASEPYTFIASIQVDSHGDPNWHRCGATLIAKDWIQTNAHCVTDQSPPYSAEDPSLFHVRIGSNNRLEGGVVRKVSGISVFPTWNWGADDGLDDELGDIALMKLDEPVPYIPVRIAAGSPSPGSKIRVLGWGFDSPEEIEPLPVNLNQLDTGIIEPGNCSAGSLPLTKGELCVDSPDENAATCGGDSGGPAVMRVDKRWQIVGSVSRHPRDVCGDGANIFTDVTYYKQWVEKNLRQAVTHASVD
uniref:S1 family peptidase n=1 Tax=Actinomadura sp. CA-154981 TaxID=3240037 RepID=UPI003F49850D